MKKKKSVRQTQLNPENTASLQGCPVDVAFFEEVESLLPLLVFAKPGQKHNRRALAAAENLLSLKEKSLEVQRIASAAAVPSQTRKVAQDEPLPTAGPSLKELFQNLTLGSMEEYLEQCRESVYLGFESTVPQDVQGWVLHWSDKLDETVGEEYLKCITDASQFIEEKWQQWQKAVEKLKPLEGKLSISSKLRSLKWASEVKKEIKETQIIRRKIDRERKSFHTSKEHLVQLSGSLAAFLKLQSSHSTHFDKSARRLIALEVEKELHSQLKLEIQMKESEVRTLLEQGTREKSRISEKRQTLMQIEDKKMQILVQGFASKTFLETPDLASATLVHLLMAFAPLSESLMDMEREQSHLKITLRTLRKEFERYREIANEYIESLSRGRASFPQDTFGSEPRDVLESFGKKAVRPAQLAGPKRN